MPLSMWVNPFRGRNVACFEQMTTQTPEVCFHIQCQILEVAHFAGILLGILVCGDPSITSMAVSDMRIN